MVFTTTDTDGTKTDETKFACNAKLTQSRKQNFHEEIF